MNGTGSERDDLGDTQTHSRHDGGSDVDAYPGGVVDPPETAGLRPPPDNGAGRLPTRPRGGYTPPPAPAFGPSPYDAPSPSYSPLPSGSFNGFGLPARPEPTPGDRSASDPPYGEASSGEPTPGVSPRDLPPRHASYVPPRDLPAQDLAHRESPFGSYDSSYDTTGGYLRSPYSEPSYGQSGHPQSSYGQTGYGQTAYGQSEYGQTLYGLPAPLSESDLPRRGEDVPIDIEPLRRSRAAQQAQQAGVDLEEEEKASRRRMMPLWQELPLLLVVAFCLAVLIRTFLLQAFFIPSSSMVGTLEVGDRVLVNKIVYDVRVPDRGEVIVFRGTDNWAPETPPEPAGSLVGRIGRTLGDLVGISRPGEKDFIKRVIGLPGDRVSCCDPQGRVYVNGKPLDEPYIYNDSPLDLPPNPRVCGPRRFEEVLVPAGQVFVMGDNRMVSMDSRCQGPVPIENIIGKAFVIVWPSARWDTLSVPDTFANVPGPVAMPAPGPEPAAPRPASAPSIEVALLLPVAARILVGTRRMGTSR